MELKIKAYSLYAACTLLIAAPVIFLAILMLLVYHVKCLRNSLGQWLADRCAEMLYWRTSVVISYIDDMRRRYTLDVE